MKIAVILSFTVLLSAFILPTDFLTEQKKYERVRTAFSEKGKLITERLTQSSISTDDLNIMIASYKAEKKLEIYFKKKSESSYNKVITYDICSSSGELGPKRRQGDFQVPEGFYHINRFNPVSNFYLSLGINYPNQSDKIKSSARDLGGDIFIHGSCVTVGCMPMTDDKIKEIYLYAIQAKNSGQNKIPVYIFPFKMTDENFNSYKEQYKDNPELIGFWTNLKTGFDKFEKDKKELNFTFDNKGNYIY